MRVYGACEMEFDPLPELKEKHGWGKIVFKTHEELDKFSKNILEKDVFFKHNYAEEWKLLKSFDRAFWLRYYRAEKPDNKPCPQGCPFDDPMVTVSMMRF